MNALAGLQGLTLLLLCQSAGEALSRLQDDGLRRDAWRVMAELAQQNGDQAAATQAWRKAAQA